MSSPYSSALLQPPAAESSTQRSAAQPAPRYTPQAAPRPYPMPMPVQYQQPQAYMVRVAPAKPRGSRIESLLLGITALIVVIAVGIAAFLAAQSYAPSEREITSYSDMAYTTGYRNGELGGIKEGRNYATDSIGRINALKTKIARQKAFNQGYRQGKRTGLNNYRNTGPGYSGYYGGSGTSYSAPTSSSYSYDTSAADVSSAIDYAQTSSLISGVPASVEVYG